MTAMPSSRQARAAAGAALVSLDSPAGIRHGTESSAAAARTDVPRRCLTLGESLREARRRHRRDRLQLVIVALDERLRSLSPSDRTRHLVAAIHDFRQELAGVRAELRTFPRQKSPYPAQGESSPP